MASKFDYKGAQDTADQLVDFFGMNAVLRRASASPTDRPCKVAIVEFQPKDRPADLANPTDRRVVMSPLDPTTGLPLEVEPDNEQDVLVTFKQPASNPPVEDEELPMTCKPKRTAPAGIVAVWEFTVTR